MCYNANLSKSDTFTDHFLKPIDKPRKIACACRDDKNSTSVRKECEWINYSQFTSGTCSWQDSTCQDSYWQQWPHSPLPTNLAVLVQCHLLPGHWTEPYYMRCHMLCKYPANQFAPGSQQLCNTKQAFDKIYCASLAELANGKGRKLKLDARPFGAYQENDLYLPEHQE